MTSKKRKRPKLPQATIHTAAELGLNRHALPHSIIDVVGTLSRANFMAYIVGGGVRDELLGLAPKDFDAVTDARPHEIKAVFGGRCRIIGRRFQLAHVYAGREMIEVATFRAPPKDDTHTTDDGMITRDNVWGTIEEDFARRDFSINALYYQPIRGEVLDFCGAIDDIRTKTLRLLGDAQVRIEEDPVRLLRALRFKAKLGFEFDKQLAAQFNDKNWALLEQVSAHRLYDESQKMACGGYLSALLPLLYQYGAMATLTKHAPAAPSALLTEIARNTDERVAQGKGVNVAFFYAGLLWDNYLHQLHKFKKRGLPFYEASAKAAARVIDEQRTRTAIPKFAEEFISDIWLLQPRLTTPKAHDVDKLSRLSRFRAAYDFLVMRERFDDHHLSEPTAGMGAWWTTHQMADMATRTAMTDKLGGRGRRNRKGDKPAEVSDELLQLQGLSGRTDTPTKRAEPLFITERARAFMDNEQRKTLPPTPTKRHVPVPSFDKVVYSDDDFMTLLNNDEPYIPAARYRKRAPSSTLSIKERAQGISDDAPKDPKTKTAKAKPADKAKSAKAPKVQQTQTPKIQKNQTAPKAKAPTDPTKKPKKRKKSNAKPKADD